MTLNMTGQCKLYVFLYFYKSVCSLKALSYLFPFSLNLVQSLLMVTYQIFVENKLKKYKYYCLKDSFWVKNLVKCDDGSFAHNE